MSKPYGGRRLAVLVPFMVVFAFFAFWLSATAHAPTSQSGNATMSFIDTDGQTKALPLITGGDPANPISGTQANADPATISVTIGTVNDKSRTNTWSDLAAAYGDEGWYQECATRNLGPNWSWGTDVPKYAAIEDAAPFGSLDARFILALNVSSGLTDDQIRQRAAADGNPDVSKLPIVRTGWIINTRSLGDKRCDPFVYDRPQIRVSLGKLVQGPDGTYRPDTSEGIFVDCHNMWRIPKTVPVPTTPTPPTTTTSPKPTPSSTTPTHTPSTPPTTSHPPTCVPPETKSSNGVCVSPKNPTAGPGSQSNVPTWQQGSAPPPSSAPEPRPSSPPSSYSAPAPPTPSQPQGTQPPPTTRTSVPPQETSAPPTSAPATGCVPPPGMTC